MIRYIKGKIVVKNQESVIVLLDSGLGYLVATTSQVLQREIHQEVVLYTHLVVRENVLQLFGFLTLEELEVFERLIEVSGVGPKVGLSIMNIGPIGDLKQAIVQENQAYIASASGVGKKTAQKIILELQGRMPQLTLVGQKDDKAKGLKYNERAELTHALTDLGFPAFKIQSVLPKLQSRGFEDQFREALRLLR